MQSSNPSPRGAVGLAILLFLGLFAAPAIANPSTEPEDSPATESETTEPGPETDREKDGDPASGAAKEKTPATLVERTSVTGSPDAVSTIPGSIYYVDEQELAKQEYGDINRILRLVPGVNIQEEEGFGLRPNIGIRGSGAERSQKITLLEDGVLAAPAPYSAPSAYYFPTAGRMEGVEVRKGSSSIQQGPFTNGGVMNLVSSSIPSNLGGRVNLALGQGDTLRGHAKVGSSYERFGWLVETYQLRTDGFKELDSGGTTGVELQDYIAKFRYTSGANARMFQALELKLGKTTQFGEETYLGVTQEDFDLTPYRRYAGSQQDTIDTDHEQIQLRYFLRPNAKVDLTASLYRNDFFRNWHKLGKVEGIGISDVLDDPTTYSGELSILRGDVDSGPDSLNVRNNRRDYFSHGLQAVVGIHPGGNKLTHDVEVGVRLHQDEEDRFQEEDLFAMVNGTMSLTTTGDPGSQANRVSSASAIAVHAQDTMAVGRWTLTPGVRVEMINMERLDYGKNDPERTGFESSLKESEVNEVIPGFGATYELDPLSRLFGGVHKGFAPPAPGATQETRAEESINYELGYRRNSRRISTEVTGFFNDYENLLGTDTASSGGEGTGDQFNGGRARIYGLEAAFTFDPGKARGLRVGLPMTAAYTYTRTEFLSSFDSNFEGWGSTVVAGDEMPYIPRHQASFGIGTVARHWSAFANLILVGEMRTLAGQGAIPREESTDAHAVLDVTGNYHLKEALKIFLQVRNLADEAYVVARRPAGLRPGLPRTVLVGVNWDF